MRKSKGFTLVELLAVLVILAIIALITTPIILGVIEDARESGAEDKAWGYISAIENAFIQDQTEVSPQSLPMVDKVVSSTTSENKIGNTQIRASGANPQEGTYSISVDGIVTVKNLKFDTYYCTTNSDATEMCCDTTQVNSCPTTSN